MRGSKKSEGNKKRALEKEKKERERKKRIPGSKGNAGGTRKKSLKQKGQGERQSEGFSKKKEEI